MTRRDKFDTERNYQRQKSKPLKLSLIGLQIMDR